MADGGMNVAPLGVPTTTPLAGWEVMTEANVKDVAKKLPRVTSGIVVLYIQNYWLVILFYRYCVQCLKNMCICSTQQREWTYSEYSLMRATGQQHYSPNSLLFMITVLLPRLSALSMFLGYLFVICSTHVIFVAYVKVSRNELTK